MIKRGFKLLPLDEKLPLALSSSLRCPVFVSETKEGTEWGLARTVKTWSGDFYDREEDFICVGPPFLYPSYKWWLTVIAHEVGHSHLHKKGMHETGIDHEIEADEWAYSSFKKESWIEPKALYSITD